MCIDRIRRCYWPSWIISIAFCMQRSILKIFISEGSEDSLRSSHSWIVDFLRRWLSSSLLISFSGNFFRIGWWSVFPIGWRPLLLSITTNLKKIRIKTRLFHSSNRIHAYLVQLRSLIKCIWKDFVLSASSDGNSIFVSGRYHHRRSATSSNELDSMDAAIMCTVRLHRCVHILASANRLRNLPILLKQRKNSPTIIFLNRKVYFLY